MQQGRILREIEILITITTFYQDVEIFHRMSKGVEY